MKHINNLRYWRLKRNLTTAHLSQKTKTQIFVHDKNFVGLTPSFLEKLKKHSIYFHKKPYVKKFKDHWTIRDSENSLIVENGAGTYCFVKEVGVSKKTIENIENGFQCKADTMKILADALEININKLYEPLEKDKQPA